MTVISIKEAKDRFSELGRAAEEGETITVTRNGKPAFVIAPLKATGGTNWEAGEKYLKSLGVERLVSWVSSDFDDPLPEDFLITPLPEDFDKPKPPPKK
jgi:prevent-host-death family protein